MTQPKYVDQLVSNEEPTDVEELVAALQDGEELVRSPGSRFAWRADGDRTTLFVDGDGIDCPLPLARALADVTALDIDLLEHEGAADLLAALLDAGSLGWAEEYEEER